MFNLKMMGLVVGAVATMGAGMVYAAAPAIDDSSTVLAREASEGPRGGDRERPGDRQRRGGCHDFTWGMHAGMLLVREATEGPRGEGQLRGRKGHVADTSMLLVREATEGPRGGDNERPGDRQRRGGKHGLDAELRAGMVLAREAAEGPRGEGERRRG